MWREKAERLRQLLEAPPPRTPEARDELHRAFRELDQALGEDLDRSDAEHRRQLEAAVDPRLVARLTSELDQLRAGLESPDLAVRKLSLFLAAGHHPHLLTEAALLKIITADPDVEMRSDALCELAERYDGTKDPAVGAILARLVVAEAEPIRIRLDAYRALLSLRGPKGHYHSSLPQLRFPDDVDWALVARFLPGADAGRSAS